LIGLKAQTKGKSTKVKNICSTEVDDGSLSLSSLSGSEDDHGKLCSSSDDGGADDDEDFNVGKITDIEVRQMFDDEVRSPWFNLYLI